MLSQSLGNFGITKATVINLTDTNAPFGLNYSLVAQRYAKTAGDLILVRPRLIGIKTRGLLETQEPRGAPVVFQGLRKDTDLKSPCRLGMKWMARLLQWTWSSFASYHSGAPSPRAIS